MASTGTSAADFGNTRKSKETINRTRVIDDGGDDAYSVSAAASPAAAEYLASLRAELLGGKPSRAPAPQPPKPRASAAPPARPSAGAVAQPSAVASSGGGGRASAIGKRRLSSAEKKKEKKERKKQQQLSGS